MFLIRGQNIQIKKLDFIIHNFQGHSNCIQHCIVLRQEQNSSLPLAEEDCQLKLEEIVSMQLVKIDKNQIRAPMTKLFVEYFLEQKLIAHHTEFIMSSDFFNFIELDCSRNFHF